MPTPDFAAGRAGRGRRARRSAAAAVRQAGGRRDRQGDHGRLEDHRPRRPAAVCGETAGPLPPAGAGRDVPARPGVHRRRSWAPGPRPEWSAAWRSSCCPGPRPRSIPTSTRSGPRSCAEYRLVRPAEDDEVRRAERDRPGRLPGPGLPRRRPGRHPLRRPGPPHFIEVNPLAGIHPAHSDLPMICGLVGISYRELIERIVRRPAGGSNGADRGPMNVVILHPAARRRRLARRTRTRSSRCRRSPRPCGTWATSRCRCPARWTWPRCAEALLDAAAARWSSTWSNRSTGPTRSSTCRRPCWTPWACPTRAIRPRPSSRPPTSCWPSGFSTWPGCRRRPGSRAATPATRHGVPGRGSATSPAAVHPQGRVGTRLPRAGRPERRDRRRCGPGPPAAARSLPPGSAGPASPSSSSRAGSSTWRSWTGPSGPEVLAAGARSTSPPSRRASRGSSAIGRSGRRFVRVRQHAAAFRFPRRGRPLLDRLRQLALACWRLFSPAGLRPGRFPRRPPGPAVDPGDQHQPLPLARRRLRRRAGRAGIPYTGDSANLEAGEIARSK